MNYLFLAILPLISFAPNAFAESNISSLDNFVAHYEQIELRPQRNCDEVVSDLKDFRRGLDRYHCDLVDYTNDLSYGISNWHRTLRQYEGQTTAFPQGYFRFIQDSADNIRQDAMWQTFQANRIDNDLEDLIYDLERCL